MHRHGVAGAGRSLSALQLRTLDILAGCCLRLKRDRLDAFRLPFRVLVEGADLIYPICAVVSHGIPAKCQGRLYDLQRDMSINSKFNPILTQFAHGI